MCISSYINFPDIKSRPEQIQLSHVHIISFGWGGTLLQYKAEIFSLSKEPKPAGKRDPFLDIQGGPKVTPHPIQQRINRLTEFSHQTTKVQLTAENQMGRDFLPTLYVRRADKGGVKLCCCCCCIVVAAVSAKICCELVLCSCCCCCCCNAVTVVVAFVIQGVDVVVIVFLSVAAVVVVAAAAAVVVITLVVADPAPAVVIAITLLL